MSLPISIPTNHNDQNTSLELEENEWPRAAVRRGLPALLNIFSIMINVGVGQHNPKDTILIGVASLVSGACCIAIAEYLSIRSQLDMEVARMESRENRRVAERQEERERLLSPVKAAAAVALAFWVVGFMPLVAGSFINDDKVRMGVVMAVMSMELVGFAWFGAVLAGVPTTRAAIRDFLAGWLAIAITFVFTKLVIQLLNLRIHHAYREANTVVDDLTKHARSTESPFALFFPKFLLILEG
ncbi:Vacuolar iron transporter like [Actinidia chinensis var. chinensis]|uniref:Vacuolar iron transporter n=1 Tax=Actinidia chinensis var. chinensis TaxID=1590841 RepID=A0A2R6QYI4_ACTCC|nr:Vacuolar iron transporter like [Actinidia chinensis var. chinensis]